jgi:hypothetical protein
MYISRFALPVPEYFVLIEMIAAGRLYCLIFGPSAVVNIAMKAARPSLDAADGWM